MTRKLISIALLLGVCGLVGCAGDPEPTDLVPKTSRLVLKFHQTLPTDSDGWGIDSVDYYTDSQSGNNFVCFIGGRFNSLSCVLVTAVKP